MNKTFSIFQSTPFIENIYDFSQTFRMTSKKARINFLTV